MTGILTTCEGEQYQLPVLYSWELSYTGGVPCDSFTVKCPYEAEMAPVLQKANRFTAKEDGGTVFYGVVDETVVSCGEKGLLLELSGRGMAALLLDNEAESTVYQCATTAEILRAHVLPYGIVCGGADSVRADGVYKVASGTSQWRALADFARSYGGIVPYFAEDGTLYLRKSPEIGTVHLDGETPVTEVVYRDRRYGVISEAAVIDRSTKVQQTVRNDAFCARGGVCRRIFYAPGHSTAQALRYTGEYQLEQSKKNAETLRVKIAGSFAARPRQRVKVTYSRLGVTGNFTVTEVTRSADGNGETTSLKMQRE